MKKYKEILEILVLFSLIWIIAYFLYSGFFGADEAGYVVFSRKFPEGIKECFQGHRMLHLLLLSFFSKNLFLAKFYGYIFSMILILAFYLILKRVIRKNDFVIFSLLSLITSPAFIVMSPTAYTEIPSLSLIMLSFYAYFRKKFSFSGVFAAFSMFFKEIGIFAEAAIILDILFKKNKESFNQIKWFFLVFLPFFTSYFIFTGKIWFLDFFLRSNEMFGPKFSLFYDFIIRKLAYFLLLGAGILPLISIKNLKKVFSSKLNVIKFYLIIAFLGYFLFHSVSPRFSTFFLPLLLFSEFFINKKNFRIFIFLFFFQTILTFYAIHLYTQPFRIEKEIANIILDSFSPSQKIYGFHFPISEKLKENGYEIVDNKTLADIVFTSKILDKKKFKIIKKIEIPCTLKFFRMLKCEDKEYVLGARYSILK